MDESRRVQIEERIQSARRLSLFSITGDLANETEWLLAELKLCTESHNQCSAELQATNARCDRLRRELDASKAEALAERGYANDWANRVRQIHDALGLKAGENGIDGAKAIRIKLEASETNAAVERKDHSDGIKAIQSQLDSLTKYTAELEKFRNTVAAVTPFQSDDNIERHAADIVSNIEGRTYRKELTEKTLPELRKRIAELEKETIELRALLITRVDASRLDAANKRITELESSIANVSSELPTEDRIREAWYSYDGTGTEASAGVARMLQERFAPLLAAKNAEAERLQLALETKTREWDVASATIDNLKEQLRRTMSDLGATESRATKAERAVKFQLPSVSKMHEWFLDGYGDARSEVSPEQDAAEANGIQYLRNKLAGLFGPEDEVVATKCAASPMVQKPTTEPSPSLRERFISETKKHRCEIAPHRPVYFHDLLRLCDVIDATPCSSTEAVSRACAAFEGTVFSVDPSTGTLRQQDWSFIGRELKKHLGYEPTVHSDQIELRDGRVWYDYDCQELTFTLN